MREVTKTGVQIAYALVISGVLLGIFGIVRTGSIFIAIGSGVIAIAHWKTGKVERYLAFAIAVALLAVAIALPKGL